MGLVRQVIGALVPFLMLTGCTRPPMLPHSPELPAQTLSLPHAPAVTDSRARFREIFCDLGTGEQSDAACEQWLPRLKGEPPAEKRIAAATASATNLKLMLVPGLFDECVRDWVDFYGEARERLREQGYDVELLAVNSRAGNRYNAAQIAEYVQSLKPWEQRRLVLLGHSKGAADILHFLVEHPETAARVAAVVSVAGAINGSPLADWAVDGMGGWETLIPSSLCDPGDEQALHSLTRLHSLSWLSRNPLPQGPLYLSLVTFSDPDTIAWPLRYAYQRLAEIDPRNDGMLLSFDQVIPGAELLGYVAADHWRVAYPIEQQAALLAGGRSPRQAFPRHLLLEAVLLYTAEALGDGEH